ncbi:expressed unknown protein [Seminavis robusta]|uniref:Uncharacterized protein n=1 Tax=Seminavis robusta TaxID=568900 RepID=A0A9N8DL41_9STRA|nr:expressed unknown protein [Seminavis robusta]|eukprot:Sro139_g065100.1 n/a (106) ;mRNA; r:59217-59534
MMDDATLVSYMYAVNTYYDHDTTTPATLVLTIGHDKSPNNNNFGLVATTQVSTKLDDKNCAAATTPVSNRSEAKYPTKQCHFTVLRKEPPVVTATENQPLHTEST